MNIKKENIIKTLKVMHNLYINNLNYKEKSFELIINDPIIFQEKKDKLKAQMVGADNVIENIISFVDEKQYNLPKNSKIVLKKILAYCLNHIDSLQKPVLFNNFSESEMEDIDQTIENKRIKLKNEIDVVRLYLKDKNII